MEQFLDGLKTVFFVLCGYFGIVVIGICLGLYKMFRRDSAKSRRELAAKKERDRLRSQENARLALLSKLDTHWLMMVPNSPESIRHLVAEGLARTFSLSGYRLGVIDEFGREWLGFGMPQTLQSLRDGEYLESDRILSLSGILYPEKCYCKNPVTINGQTTLVYPSWLNAEHTNTLEWQRWMALEKAFVDSHSDLETFQKELQDILPPEHLQKVRERRKNL